MCEREFPQYLSSPIEQMNKHATNICEYRYACACGFGNFGGKVSIYIWGPCCLVWSVEVWSWTPKNKK